MAHLQIKRYFMKTRCESTTLLLYLQSAQMNTAYSAVSANPISYARQIKMNPTFGFQSG